MLLLKEFLRYNTEGAITIYEGLNQLGGFIMNSWQEIFKYLGLITYLGLLVAGSIYIGLLGGEFLDDLFGTNQIFTVIGILIGAISGLYLLYKTAMKFSD